MLTFLDGAAHDLTSNGFALVALAIFIIAYSLVVCEDLIHLRKSKPVIFAAGTIWIMVAIAFVQTGLGTDDLASRVKHHVADFAELFLFLMVAMTYISAIAERNVFMWINAWLVSAGFGLRAVFWVTGALSFVISPIADNLTTALLMGAVVTTVGRGNPAFIAMACVNVVVAANAGGAFSPFGDITTLMVWQVGKVETVEFLAIFLPSLVNWLVPAALMTLAIPKKKPEPVTEEVVLKQGWWLVIVMFLLTIGTAVSFHAFLHLPPFLGMTTGLTYFMIYGYTRQLAAKKYEKAEPVDVLKNVADVEWDTMLFFFGVIMCVGGLAELGYLQQASVALYDQYGATVANCSVGFISAVLDNVPVMFAVLKMDPQMGTNEAENLYQWLLITLTAGVGGSMLSVGSAAGVALMGTARGMYTFGAHLKWAPVVLLGYAASIYVHYLMNAPTPATN